MNQRTKPRVPDILSEICPSCSSGRMVLCDLSYIAPTEYLGNHWLNDYAHVSRVDAVRRKMARLSAEALGKDDDAH